MSIPRVIGLTGRKGHGKDTVAKLLEPYGYEVLRFADPLKNMLRALLLDAGVAPEMVERCVEGDLKQQEILQLGLNTPRHAMQTLGTEWGRGCMGENFWVDIFSCRTKRYFRVVVPDVRFENECAAIRSMGGKVFRVDAGARVPPDEFSNHASETEIDRLLLDEFIDNSGPESSLFSKIQRVMQVPVDNFYFAK